MEQKEAAESKDSFGSEARDRVNKSYSAHTASMEGLGEKSEPSLPESVKEDAPTETSPAEEVTEPSTGNEGDGGFEPEQAPSGETEDKKTGDEAKTVPLEALHAERERRKELQTKQSELEEQVQTLLQDAKERAEHEQLANETLENPDAEVIKLRREVEELKNKDSKRDADSETKAVEESQKKLKENITSTDKSLAEEGFPGFAFAQAVVAGEINALIAEDSDNDYMLNDPKAWMRVYKERVYPGMKKAFTSKERAEKNAEKEALKDEAGLAGNAGKPNTPSAKKKEEAWTYDKYLEMRQKRAPA